MMNYSAVENQFAVFIWIQSTDKIGLVCLSIRMCMLKYDSFLSNRTFCLWHQNTNERQNNSQKHWIRINGRAIMTRNFIKFYLAILRCRSSVPSRSVYCSAYLTPDAVATSEPAMARASARKETKEKCFDRRYNERESLDDSFFDRRHPVWWCHRQAEMGCPFAFNYSLYPFDFEIYASKK